LLLAGMFCEQRRKGLMLTHIVVAEHKFNHRDTEITEEHGAFSALSESLWLKSV
jgi:hypothetical protein